MAYEKLFAGNQERYLTFNLSSLNARDEDGKLVPDYKTIKREVSEKIWTQHLNGEISLGLSPLRDGKVKWGAVDIDVYPFLETDDELEALMRKWADPCLVSRSKSGGIHIIAFTRDWVDADVMRKYLAAKRDAVLEPKILAHADEIFPKQKDGNGSQMNLPQCGSERPVLAWKAGSTIQFCGRTKHGNVFEPDWLEIAAQCYVPESHMASVIISALTKTPKRSTKLREKKSYAGGFKRPTSGKAMEGRNSFLFHCGASARARGAADDEISEIIHGINDEFNNPDSEFGSKGPIADNKRLSTVIEQVQKLPQGEVADLAYDVVERMNAEWALMFVDGSFEVLNTKTDKPYSMAAFQLKLRPYKLRGREITAYWLDDPDRREYDGYVIEAPDYDGEGYNIFQGWKVEPTNGDATLWEAYVKDILCSGDADLAHWVMSFLADAVQRPWSKHPGTAIALRGGQGGGKSFLGKAMRAILPKAHIAEFAQSDRLLGQFNRSMFGASFVLAEESFFAGSRKMAAAAKVLVESDEWTYEQKYLASFSAKNVHRVIATTNEDQAVHVDFDDRRWTVIEVPTIFDDTNRLEGRKWWDPYYALLRDDPGAVLRYLLEYEVDQDLIASPWVTAAKASDKIASDPVIALMDDIARIGSCPDDLRGDGRISSATLAREAWARGASRYDNPRRFSNQLRDKFGGMTASNCINIEKVEYRQTPDGILTPYVIKRTDRAGVQLPALSEFRRIVSKVTGETYPDDGDWLEHHIADPETVNDIDPNSGDVDGVLQYVKDNGAIVKEDIPF